MQTSPLLSAITQTGMHLAAIIDALVADSPTNGNRGMDFSLEAASKILPGALLGLNDK